MINEKFETQTVPTGIGGAPTRATILPDDATERKKFPLASGLMDYFPDALAAVANVSYIGNEQHNPGQPLHWDRAKSGDEDDTMLRHFSQRGTRDKDGARHSAKMVWRSLALLQKEIETEKISAPHSGVTKYRALRYGETIQQGDISIPSILLGFILAALLWSLFA